MAVSVLGKRNKPLMPRWQKRARLRLTRGRAAVHPRHPFTIGSNDRVGGDVQPVKIDPGRKITGVAIITAEDANKPAKVPCPFELTQPGPQISKALSGLRAFRRRRRSANLRGKDSYRHARRPALPPLAEARGVTCGRLG